MRVQSGVNRRQLLARFRIPGWMLSGVAATLAFLGGVSAPVLPAHATVTLTGWTVDSGSSTNANNPLTPQLPAGVSAIPQVTALPARDAASDKVGATVGEFRVSEDGATTYRVPIYAAPGRAGVVPQIAVSYSQRGMTTGPLGTGFSLEGLSAISRCRQSREAGDFLSDPLQDGNPHPVDFTADDAFCLDGQRLLATNDAPPTSGGGLKVFYPELDPFTRVIVHGTSLADPDYFRVQRKDGSTSWYGQGRGGRLTVSAGGATPALTWAINHFQDSLGNAILYNYSQPAGTSGELQLDSIQYTATATAGQPAAPSTSNSGFASITFTYSALAQAAWSLSYVSGALITHSRQLDTIEVFDGATKLRRYNLSYQTSPSLSGLRQLSQVEECSGLDTTVCYKPTTFTWSGARYRFETDSEQTPAGPNFGSLVGYKLGDVDGDGRLDLVWWKNGESGCSNSKLYVSFADRSGTQFTYDTRAAGYCSPRNLASNDDTWQLLDYDGDGRDDLMIAGAAGGNWKLFLASATVSSRGTPYNTGTDQLAVDGVAIPVTTEDFRHGQFADFNGDGLLDVMTPDAVQSSNTYGSLLVRFLEKQPSGRYGFSAPYQTVAEYTVGDPCETGAVDCYFDFYNWNGKRIGVANEINGDGRADLLFRMTRSSTPAVVQGAAKYATDTMLGGTITAPASVSLHAWYTFVAGQRTPANGFTPAQFHMHQTWDSTANTVATGLMPQTSDGLYLADFNGDGLNDIFYKDQSVSDQYNLLLNTGTGFLAKVAVSGVLNGSALQLADVDGDGRADLLYPPGNSTDTYFRAYKVRHWQYSASSPGGSFSAATDIAGGGAAVTYLNQWTHIFADIDGDGAVDYLRVQFSGGTGSNFLYASRAAAGERYRARDAITTITNGYGAVTQLTYQPLTNHAVYRRDMGSRDGLGYGRGTAVQDLLVPMYVVSQASSSAPTETNAAALSTVRYRYEGAKVQGGGRGFLGFRRVASVDTNDYAAGSSVDGYVWTRTDYRQDFPFVGMPDSTYKYASHAALTLGTAHLDACYANIEAANETCFTDLSTSQAFASLAGNAVSTANQVWQCRGTITGDAACPAPVGGNYCATSGNLASRFSTSGYGPVKPAEVINPAIPQQPIFPRLYGTLEVSLDPDNAVTGINHLAYSSFCHDTHGNVTHSEIDQRDGADVTRSRKIVDNTYTDTEDTWRLGRLTSTTAHSARPDVVNIDRTANFSYAGTGTGLLTSEKVTQSDNTNLTLRTLTDYDTYGNKNYLYQCSADLSDTAGKNLTTMKHRPVGASGPTTTVQRFVHTTYDAAGRYTTATKVPYYDPAVPTKQWTERASSTVVSRSEFGDVTEQIDANGVHTRIAVGYLGREYARNDDTGAASAKTYRWCTDVGITCPAGAVFREAATAAGAPSTWTYYDVLGRPRMTVTQTFNAGVAGKDLSATCVFRDAHGRTVKTTEPFFLAGIEGANGPSLTGTACATATTQTTSAFDVIDRVKTITRPDTSTETYQYSGLTTTRTNGLLKTWTETKTALGEVDTLSDPNGFSIQHDYDGEGKLKAVRRNAGVGEITTTVFYDSLGRKKQQVDPDLGTWNYEYSAAGELIRQTDAKGQVIEQDFDALGRVWRRTVRSVSSGPGCPAVADRLFCNGFELGSTPSAGTVVHLYQYDTAAYGFGALDFEQTTQADGSVFRRALTYDTLARLSTRSSLIDGTTYTESLTYDGIGRLSQQYDASPDIASSGVETAYTPRGYVQTLTALNLSGVSLLNEVTEHNARGQVTKERRGGSTAMEITRTYDPSTGRPDTVCAGSNCVIQDADYDFDVEGNLTAREKNKTYQGGLHAYREEFAYDGLNRLQTAKLTKIDGVTQGSPLTLTSLAYDNLGNICQKNGQAYTYGGLSGCAGAGANATQSPHAAKAAFGKTYAYDFNGNLVFADAAGTANDRTLTYTGENLAASIKTSVAEARFLYGPDQTRYKRTDVRTSGPNAGTTITRYVGNLELVTLPSGTQQVKRYFGGVAMIVSQSGAITPYYLFTDHLGSIERITSASGSVIEAMSFDAHGARRDAADWQGPPATLPTTTTHGFVGLEHVDDFGLVHMNGRIYDSELGRFVQADSQIEQDATQGLNRYTYVLNNPLSYTDPSGHSIGGFFKKYWRAIAAIAITIFAPYLLPMIGVTGFWAAVATGFVAGCVATGSLQGGLYGAFSAGLFYGIGTAFSQSNASWAYTNGELNAGGLAAKTLAHGVAGGVMSSLQGDTFGHGFVSAGVTQAFSGKIDGIDKYNEGFSAQRTFAAAMLGGSVTAATGGKFANGALTAAFSRAFNDEMGHKAYQARLKELQAKYPMISSGVVDAAYDWLSGVNPDSADPSGSGKQSEYTSVLLDRNDGAGVVDTGTTRGVAGHSPWIIPATDNSSVVGLPHTHGYGGEWYYQYFSSDDVNAATILGRPVPVFLSNSNGDFSAFYPGMPVGGRIPNSMMRLPTGSAQGFLLCHACVPVRQPK